MLFQFFDLRKQKSGFTALALVMLFGMCPVSPAEGAGLKGKLKRALSTKDNGKQPLVELSSIAEESEGNDPAKPGRQNVLLVSVPRNTTEIDEGTGIAFIDFKHIEHDVSSDLQERKVITYREVTEALNGGDVRHRVEEEGYSSEICARQVEAALGQHLADLNLYKVLTRDHIKEVLDELDFSYSGSADTTTTARLGNLTGARILLYGQVQLCVSSTQDYETLSRLALRAGEAAGEHSSGWLGNLVGAVKEVIPEKVRAFVLAQVQLIDSETGKRIFTSSLSGEFEDSRGALAYDMSHRELIYRAAEDLANNFIDDLLARQEAQYLALYTDDRLDFRPGLELIQLGDCAQAEQYFRDVYARKVRKMSEMDLARLMYNHGVALMCANRPREALDRLWASLRLKNDASTFQAISFTNDTVDRGRRIVQEEDEIIRTIRERRFSSQVAKVAPAPGTLSADVSPVP
ncbi:MAG: CsgG/HfaB family protein [Acidobacteriota bacterium]